ncbi:MAG: alkaline phosphatase family protein [Myxococcota bacterium]
MGDAKAGASRSAWAVALAVSVGCGADDAADGGQQGSSGSTAPTSTTDAPTTEPSGLDETTAVATSAAESGATTSGEETGPGQHTVGGALEGLQGATVEIINGEDALTLDADGPFTFPSIVDDGDDYAVQVQVQPIGPDQTCTVIGGEGTVAGADIEDIVVRCVTPIRHVVLLGIDGFGGEWFDVADTPALDALRDESRWTLDMQDALPTSSSTNWMSMIGGAGPQQHGVLSNGWQPGDSSPPATMFAALRQHQPDATIGIFHDWSDFARLTEPGVADHIEHPGDEQDTMDAATAWLEGELPTLLFVHIDHVDGAGHSTTWGSGGYLDAIETADDLVGQLRTSLEDAGMWPYTAILVSSDHGGEGFSHGADTRGERATPFLMRAPQSGAGLIERDLRIWDIAATALALLEVPEPEGWIASPVVEGLYGSDLTLPPGPAEAEAVSVTDTVWLYDDTGTLAFSDVSLWRPIVPEGYALLGDIAVGGHDAPTTPALSIVDDPLLVQPPRGFELIWQDTLSGGVNDVSIWNPIPPLGFVCMGAVAVAGYTEPEIPNLRCVHADLVQRGLSAMTWDDAGSGALWDASLWTCIPGGDADPSASGLATGGFMARRHGSDAGAQRCNTLRPELVTVAR